MASHKVVSPDEWREARIALLEEEKKFVRLKEELAAKRRELPWEEITTEYTFHHTDGTPVRLRDLFDGFQQGKPDLIVVHYMYDPEWSKGCSSCSFWADGYDGYLPHFLNKGNFVVVGKAPPEQLKAVQETKGWKFPFLSSHESTFNHDFGVEFTAEEREGKTVPYNYTGEPFVSQMPGWSVFRKEGDKVYHTYSTYARGLDILNASYQWMDLLPSGRQEEKPNTMSWVKHKEEY